MEVYVTLVEMIKNPDAPKFYRDLQKFYKNKGMENEAQAFLKLLEIKFNKNVSDN